MRKRNEKEIPEIVCFSDPSIIQDTSNLPGVVAVRCSGLGFHTTRRLYRIAFNFGHALAQVIEYSDDEIKNRLELWLLVFEHIIHSVYRRLLDCTVIPNSHKGVSFTIGEESLNHRTRFPLLGAELSENSKVREQISLPHREILASFYLYDTQKRTFLDCLSTITTKPRVSLPNDMNTP